MNLEFLLRYPDEVRYPIITDCDDWDSIDESLATLESQMSSWAIVLDDDARLLWMNNMRVFFEALYVAGYFRGRGSLKEELPPT